MYHWNDFSPRYHDAFGGLVEDRAIDAVVIATPNLLHAPQAIACLEAGVHVLVEKPMARSVAECDAMLAAANR